MRELDTTIVSSRPLTALEDTERALFKAVSGSDDNEDGGSLAVATEETIFHPQGGGQPSDSGTITVRPGDEDDEDESLILDVKLVRKLPGGQIVHVGSLNNNNLQASSFQPSRPVLLTINDSKRTYHSRLHTAGHILGLAVRQLQLAGLLPADLSEGKANHAPGSSFVEFHGLIDSKSDHKTAIQQAANDIVHRNLSVLVHWWDGAQVRARCTAVPDAVPLDPGEEVMRVVEIDGIGAYPCGGTHLPSTADVGPVVVRKIGRQKGVTKLSYEVG